MLRFYHPDFPLTMKESPTLSRPTKSLVSSEFIASKVLSWSLSTQLLEMLVVEVSDSKLPSSEKIGFIVVVSFLLVSLSSVHLFGSTIIAQEHDENTSLCCLTVNFIASNFVVQGASLYLAIKSNQDATYVILFFLTLVLSISEAVNALRCLAQLWHAPENLLETNLIVNDYTTTATHQQNSQAIRQELLSFFGYRAILAIFATAGIVLKSIKWDDPLLNQIGKLVIVGVYLIDTPLAALYTGRKMTAIPALICARQRNQLLALSVSDSNNTVNPQAQAAIQDSPKA